MEKYNLYFKVGDSYAKSYNKLIIDLNEIISDVISDESGSARISVMNDDIEVFLFYCDFNKNHVIYGCNDFIENLLKDLNTLTFKNVVDYYFQNIDEVIKAQEWHYKYEMERLNQTLKFKKEYASIAQMDEHLA